MKYSRFVFDVSFFTAEFVSRWKQSVLWMTFTRWLKTYPLRKRPPRLKMFAPCEWNLEKFETFWAEFHSWFVTKDDEVYQDPFDWHLLSARFTFLNFSKSFFSSASSTSSNNFKLKFGETVAQMPPKRWGRENFSMRRRKAKASLTYLSSPCRKSLKMLLKKRPWDFVKHFETFACGFGWLHSNFCFKLPSCVSKNRWSLGH